MAGSSEQFLAKARAATTAKQRSFTPKDRFHLKDIHMHLLFWLLQNDLILLLSTVSFFPARLTITYHAPVPTVAQGNTKHLLPQGVTVSRDTTDFSAWLSVGGCSDDFHSFLVLLLSTVLPQGLPDALPCHTNTSVCGNCCAIGYAFSPFE